MDEDWLGSSCSVVVEKGNRAKLEYVIIGKGTCAFNNVKL